jgi:hypothetical protein
VEVAFCVCADSQLDGGKKEFDASSDSESSLCHSWWTTIGGGKGGSVGRFCVLDFFIEMLACEVIGSGSLVGETCRLMEGDDATT